MTAIQSVVVSAYRIPTDGPESDGTLEWNSTTLVLVEVEGGGVKALGYTYADRSTAVMIQDKLAASVEGRDALDVTANWNRMMTCIRNLGRCGVAAMAVSAVDMALWDLKARLLELPLVRLLGPTRASVRAYGSGGFTSYFGVQLREQLGGWAKMGLKHVKMKVGREPSKDLDRVWAAREAIGPDVELFTDANGAYNRKEALRQAEGFADADVRWFEEPVSSDDLLGLRLMRDRAPGRIAIAAGEYGYDLPYFRNMIVAGAVDVLQADITRCCGLTGFLKVGALAEAHQVPLSAHTAPSAHVHPCCALEGVRHIEYFHDHARIEAMLFDGAMSPQNGELAPDLSRLGLGLEFKRADALPYAI